MNANPNPILLGVIAGLAAAILLAGAAYVGFFAVIMIIGAMTAVFIAGLGFGLTSCVVAIATAGLATAAVFSNPLSFVAMALMLLPAAVMSYLANLARPATELGGPDTAMAWYPLSDILLAGAGLVAVGTIATLTLQTDLATVYSTLADMIIRMMTEIDPPLPVDAGTKIQLVDMFEIFFPMMQSMQMMIGLFAGFYFALRILAAFGRSMRPREDIRSSLRMNRLSILVFLAGIALMFAGDRVEMIGASFAGAVAGGFLLSGFAIIHNVLRDKSWRMPGLILAYLLTLMVPIIPLLLIIAGGLANPRRAVALTPNKPNET
jgi:hypothetical protein